MVYSLTPIIGTIAVWPLVLIALGMFGILFAAVFADEVEGWKVWGVLAIALSMIGGGFVFNIKMTETAEREAEKRFVIGSAVAEFHGTYSVRSGKRTKEQSTMYIEYSTPDGSVISFRKRDGYVYPDQVKLYYK